MCPLETLKWAALNLRKEEVAGRSVLEVGSMDINGSVRYLGEAPLIEDDSVRAEASLLVNAGIAWKRNAAEFRLDVFNLLDSDDDDISYFYASRLPGEPAGGIEDTHFHPLEPRTVRASVTVLWQ